MFLVCGDNRLHQRVTHHIVFAKKMKGNSGCFAQGTGRFDESARLVPWKINLGAISGHDTFRVDADPC